MRQQFRKSLAQARRKAAQKAFGVTVGIDVVIADLPAARPTAFFQDDDTLSEQSAQMSGIAGGDQHADTGRSGPHYR